MTRGTAVQPWSCSFNNTHDKHHFQHLTDILLKKHLNNLNDINFNTFVPVKYRKTLFPSIKCYSVLLSLAFLSYEHPKASQKLHTGLFLRVFKVRTGQMSVPRRQRQSYKLLVLFSLILVFDCSSFNPV